MLYVIKFGDTELSGDDLLALHDKASQQQETDSPAYSVTTYEDEEAWLLDSVPEEFHQFVKGRASSEFVRGSGFPYLTILMSITADLKKAINNFETQIIAQTQKRVRDQYQ